MTGAGPFIAPPLARNPLIVGNSLFVSKVQTTRPSTVEWARTAPSFDGENTMPGIVDTAENWAPLQARPGFPQTGGSGAEYQARPPQPRSMGGGRPRPGW